MVHRLMTLGMLMCDEPQGRLIAAKRVDTMCRAWCVNWVGCTSKPTLTVLPPLKRTGGSQQLRLLWNTPYTGFSQFTCPFLIKGACSECTQNQQIYQQMNWFSIIIAQMMMMMMPPEQEDAACCPNLIKQLKKLLWKDRQGPTLSSKMSLTTILPSSISL